MRNPMFEHIQQPIKIGKIRSHDAYWSVHSHSVSLKFGYGSGLTLLKTPSLETSCWLSARNINTTQYPLVSNILKAHTKLLSRRALQRDWNHAGGKIVIIRQNNIERLIKKQFKSKDYLRRCIRCTGIFFLSGIQSQFLDR